MGIFSHKCCILRQKFSDKKSFSQFSISHKLRPGNFCHSSQHLLPYILLLFAINHVCELGSNFGYTAQTAYNSRTNKVATMME